MKTLETLVDYYLQENTLRSRGTRPAQHVYQISNSAQTAIHNIVRSLGRALDKNRLTFSVFLDMEGEFDDTPFETSKALRPLESEKHTLKMVRRHTRKIARKSSHK